MSEITDIYVYLPNEGMDAWRPVKAEHVQDDLFRIVDMKEDEDEVWEFNFGDLVVCKMTEFAEGQHLAAVCIAYQ